jgi:hypothetical protein
MRYVVYSTVETTDDSGNPVAPHTVLNTLLWDGVTPYNPGPNLVLVRSDTLQVGDTAP